MRTFIALIILSMVYGVAHGEECKSELNLGIIQDRKETAKNAELLAQEFRSIRGERDLEKKMGLFLAKIAQMNKVLRSHQGRLNILNELANASKSFEEYRIANYKATDAEAGRVQETISKALKLLKGKQIKPGEVHDLEFSVNGLLDVAISRLKSIESGANEDAEHQLHYCQWKQGDIPIPIDVMRRLKGVLSDWMLFGVIINPLRAGAVSGKYNMSVTRIELLNQRHSGSGSTKAEEGVR